MALLRSDKGPGTLILGTYVVNVGLWYADHSYGLCLPKDFKEKVDQQMSRILFLELVSNSGHLKFQCWYSTQTHVPETTTCVSRIIWRPMENIKETNAIFTIALRKITSKAAFFQAWRLAFTSTLFMERNKIVVSGYKTFRTVWPFVTTNHGKHWYVSLVFAGFGFITYQLVIIYWGHVQSGFSAGKTCWEWEETAQWEDCESKSKWCLGIPNRASSWLG